MMLFAIEERENGSTWIHPPAPAEPEPLDGQATFAQLKRILRDENLPTVEQVDPLETVVVEGIRHVLPEVLKPMAEDAVGSVKGWLSKFQPNPGRMRAPIGNK